jgi:hypothetical protein
MQRQTKKQERHEPRCLRDPLEQGTIHGIEGTS